MERVALSSGGGVAAISDRYRAQPAAPGSETAGSFQVLEAMLTRIFKLFGRCHGTPSSSQASADGSLPCCHAHPWRVL